MLLLLSSLVFVLLLLYPQETDAFAIQKGSRRHVNDNIPANFVFIQSRHYSQTIYHHQRNIIQLSIQLKSSKIISVSATKEEEEQQQQESTQEQKHRHCRNKISILVCPAQFCVPDDYNILFDDLHSDDTIEIGTCVVCQLPQTEWIKVAKQLPTINFVQGTLNVPKTLDWYFISIETAATTIFSTELQYGNINPSICIIGHSIGGWIARAYLGGMSQSSTAIYPALVNACTSLITFGTPHSVSNNAIVDQTRGLINSIDSTSMCTPKYLVELLEVLINKNEQTNPRYREFIWTLMKHTRSLVT
jgi:ferredoxin-like protein FixX